MSHEPVWVRMVIREPEVDGIVGKLVDVYDQQLTPGGNMPKYMQETFVRAVTTGHKVEAFKKTD